MMALALSLDPAGRQPRGIPGRHAAPPAPDPDRARDDFSRRERHNRSALAASLLLHLLVAGAAVAAFTGETMGGAGGSAGDSQGGGILVELVALAPAGASNDAAPETLSAETSEAAPHEIVLPPPPSDAEAVPLNVPPPEPVKTVAEEKPRSVEKPKPTEAKRETARPPSAEDTTAPHQAAAGDTISATRGNAADTTSGASNASANAGAPGDADMGGSGGLQVAALGGAGVRVLQARFRVSPPPPPYPRRALSLQQEGVVLLRALIDEQGAAREVKLQASSGYPLLDKAALQAVGEWQFLPETVNGRPVAVWVEVPVRFQID